MRNVVAVCLALTSAAVAQPASDLTREFQAGVDAFRLGKFDEARTHLEKARSLDPKLPGPYRFLAAVAQAQSRWQDCIDAARKAIELNPRSAEIGDTRKVHDECRVSAGRQAYREELGDSAAIAVVTSVPGATVKIGGLNYGGTPLAPRPITAGTLEVDIEKAGWKPAHLTVEALPGIVTDVTLDLEPDPNAQTSNELTPKPIETKIGKLIVPADVTELSVDGQRMTPSAAHELELATGEHTLIIERAGHDPWRRRVRITAVQKTRIAPEFVATAPREHTERVGMALVGTGAAVAVFGFIAAMKSDHASADAREIERVETAHPPAGQYTRGDFNDARDRATKWSRISAVAYGAGLVAVGAGAIFMYLGAKERSDVPAPFAVTPVTGGAVVTKGMAF